MSYDTNDAGDSDISERGTNTESHPTTVHHEWRQSDQPSMAIVQAVATATDRTMTDLPPLQRTIDSDALDTLFIQGDPSSVAVSFDYADTTVWVYGDGSIEIRVDWQFEN